MNAFVRSIAPRMPALRELEELDLDLALAAFVPCEVGPGEVLISGDDEEYPALLMVEGEVSLSTTAHPPVKLGRVGPGGLIGGAPLHGGRRPPVRVQTDMPCKLLILESAGAEWLMLHAPAALERLRLEALQHYTSCLRSVSERLSALARLPSEPLSAAPPSFFSRWMARFGLPRGEAPALPQVLSRSQCFGDLDAVAAGWLMDRMELLPLSSKQSVQIERAPSTGVWCVAEGALELFRDVAAGKVERAGSIGPGGFVGLPGLVDGGRAELTCVTRGPSWLYHMPPERAYEVMRAQEANPMRRALLAALHEQLRQACIGLDEVADQARRGPLGDPKMLRATLCALWSAR